MSPDVIDGFLQASQYSTILAVAAGCLIGLVVGMIPGLTISTGIIIVLPLTFVLPPEISIALLLGLYVSGMTGGSFSAILLNIPGTPSASATALDGNPMASRGEAGRALGIAITASFIGGLLSFLCLYFIAPVLADIALQFQSPDLFSLVFFGLTIICSFAAKSLINLIAGVHFLTALIGLFAVPQLVENFAEMAKSDAAARSAAKIKSVLPSLSDLKLMRLPVSIGGVAGSFLGILPGAGGPIAAFISYDYSRRLSKKPDEFGQGSPQGIAAPEAANNAVTGGALIPMMTLGIPGDPVTAILIGALLIHGLAPGPLLFVENGEFAYGLIFSFFWANIFNIIIALIGLRLLVKVLSIPKAFLMPTIAILCVIGSYALRNNFFDVYVMFGFGLLGLAMRWLNMPIIPLLLAMVLGRQLEEHLRVSLIASKNDISIFFTQPFSLFFLCLAAASVAWSFWAEYKSRQAQQQSSSPSEGG
jgi:putative tricarboxylic transport membrane protein